MRVMPLPAPRAAAPQLRISPRVACAVVAFAILAPAGADAAFAPAQPGVLAVLWQWTPLLLRGFGLNILISALAMAIGTALGAALGLGLLTPARPLRGACWGVTQFFRNAPWLVLLFFMIYLLPFHLHLGPLTITLPDWLKAVIGLALPVMANVAEIVRGAVVSIAPGQWEAGESLGFTRRQQLYQIILPQSFRRMLPPWMNLYAILATSTTLASIVGVDEVVTLAGQVLAAEGGRTDLLAPLYAYVLLMFFIYTYPIARATQWLERRSNV